MKKSSTQTPLPRLTAALSRAFGVPAAMPKNAHKRPVLATHWYV